MKKCTDAGAFVVLFVVLVVGALVADVFLLEGVGVGLEDLCG